MYRASTRNELLEQVRELMEEWDEHGTMGEIVIVCGRNEHQLEERPRLKRAATGRGAAERKVVETN